MSRKFRAVPVLVAGAMALGGMGFIAPAAFAGDTSQAPWTDSATGASEVKDAQTSLNAAEQGMVLLKNDNDALPLATKGNIALFGEGTQNIVKGGTGSGAVNNRVIDLKTGQPLPKDSDGNYPSVYQVDSAFTNAGYTITTNQAYWKALAANIAKHPQTSGGMGGEEDFAAEEEPLTPATVEPTAPTDTAVYIASRNAGEGADRTATKGDYYLTDTEVANLKLIGQTYKHVVVVLNVGGVMDTNFVSDINNDVTDPDSGEAIDALVYAAQPGEESGQAILDVLNGTTNPSGKLVDTWASDYSCYPASATFSTNDGDDNNEQYSEDVFVGYRYFDSFFSQLNKQGCTVNYPFGYGLSYTTFRVQTDSVSAPSLSSDVTVKATVTNTGKVAGKDVVEVYYSAPGADKPYQELIGYGKTGMIPAGKAQQVTVTFDPTQMASYNESAAAYIMDKGSYVLRVGDSSRDTAVAAVLTLGAKTITDQVDNELDDETPNSVLVSNRANFYSYPAEAAQVATAPTYALSLAGYKAADNQSPYEQSVSLTPDQAGSDLGPDAGTYYAVEAPDINDSDGVTYAPTGADGKPVYQTAQKYATTTAYLQNPSADWEGTGAPYQAKLGEDVKQITVPADCTTLYAVYQGTCTMQQFVSTMSLDELADIVEGTSMDQSGDTLIASGTAGYTTAAYKDQGIPQMSLSDGPAGLRINQSYTLNGTTYYQYTTAWPIGTLLAQTWDLALVKSVYEGVGAEMEHFGATMWLAPGSNLHRDPLNGRNFEYYSEDPLVAGENAAMAASGVQESPGVGVTMKHFFGNNQENNRMNANAIMTERAAREMYLKVWQIAVEVGQPMGVMSSYNRVNGTNTAGERDLLTDILRGEWGYKGLVMTDWGGVDAGIVETMYAGNDLIEPGSGQSDVKYATKAYPVSWDVTGLPVMDYAGLPVCYGSWGCFGGSTIQWGNNEAAADGADVHTTHIDSTIVGQAVASTQTVTDSINNTTVSPWPSQSFDSVQAAYDFVSQMIDPSVTSASDSANDAFTTAEKAGMSIENVTKDDSGAVTAFDVVVKTNPTSANYLMRLGDLQTNAERILNVVMNSKAFEDLSKAQVAGTASVKCADAVPVTVGSWTAKWASVESNQLGSTTGAVTAAPAAPATPNPAADAPTGQILAAYVAAVAPLKAADYTAASWAPFAAALAAANQALASGDSAALAKALVGLERAEMGLVTAGPAQNQVKVLKTARPSIKGTVKTGKTVKVKKGSWTANTKYTVKWYVNGKKVKTASKLKIKSAYYGKKLVVKVTGKKAGYKTVTRASKSKKIK